MLPLFCRALPGFFPAEARVADRPRAGTMGVAKGDAKSEASAEPRGCGPSATGASRRSWLQALAWSPGRLAHTAPWCSPDLSEVPAPSGDRGKDPAQIGAGAGGNVPLRFCRGGNVPLRFCGGGRGATPFLARGRSPFRPGLGSPTDDTVFASLAPLSAPGLGVSGPAKSWGRARPSGPAKLLQGGPWRRSWPQALAWSRLHRREAGAVQQIDPLPSQKVR